MRWAKVSKPSRVTTPACCKSRSEYPMLIKPGAQAAAGRIADAHSFDQLRLVHAALCQVGHRFWMTMQLDLIELDDVAQQRAHA